MASKAKDATSNPALIADPAAEATTKWDTSTRAGQFAVKHLCMASVVLQHVCSTASIHVASAEWPQGLVFDVSLMPSGSDVGSMGRQDLKAGCGDLFRENPEMKQVHSLASAAALLKRVADSSAA